MQQNLNDYSDEECRKLNGQTVMTVLTSFGDAATSDKICDEIAQMTDQPKQLIETEVKSILRRGISHGFLVKFGKKYLLSGKDIITELDIKRKSYGKIGKNYGDIGKKIKRKSRNLKSIEKSSDGQGENSRIHRNIALRLDSQDDSVDKNQLVVINPNDALNAILQDLTEEIETPDQTPDGQFITIDLRAIIAKNLNNLSEPYNE